MGIFKIKNKIRDFIRKYDEIVTPILRFVWALIVFMSVQKMFNYSDLGAKKEVTVLLAVLAALLPDAFMFFMAGVLIALHTFSASLEVGAIFLVMFILMYATYVRFFPKYAYVVLMVPVFYLLDIPFAAPIIVALVAGIGGLVPAIYGVVIYYFSDCTKEIVRQISIQDADDQLETIKNLMNTFLNNKEMYIVFVIFAITILFTSIMIKFNYPYAMYVAIGAGTIINVVGAIFAGSVMHIDAPMDKVFLGTIVGVILALVLRFGQGILDYQHTQRVQFEDDDYYYYVKAVPKIDSEKPKTEKTKAAKRPVKRPEKKTEAPVEQGQIVS